VKFDRFLGIAWKFRTRAIRQRRDGITVMKLNICIVLAVMSIAIVGLTGCASDEATTTTTETTETRVTHPSVTTETQTVR